MPDFDQKPEDADLKFFMPIMRFLTRMEERFGRATTKKVMLAVLWALFALTVLAIVMTFKDLV